MSRSALGAMVLFLSTAALGDGTQRYFVATRRPAHEVTSRAALARDEAAHRTIEYDLVKGFTADLTDAEVAALRVSSDVRFIEPVAARRLLSVAVAGEQTMPYGIAKIHAPQTWTARQSVAVNVAIIDSGIESRHPDLRRAWTGGHDLFDANGNGGTDTVGHGTHVAGTIAATDNTLGVVGIAPSALLWSVRAFDSENGTMENVVRGLQWVVQKKNEIGGRWIVNMSLGGEVPSEAEREAFRNAADQGIVLVAASGNESFPSAPKPVSYPAAYDSVIAVGATDETDTHAYFSNQGPELDFSAPGMRVLSSDRIKDDEWLAYVRSGNRVLLSRPLDGSKLRSITGEIVNCGLGRSGEFPPDVLGRIALMQRGVETFADKTRRAREAGAVGVIIFNTDDSAIRWTLYDDAASKNYDWPVAQALSKEDGEWLVAQQGARVTVSAEPDAYSLRTGTSMSCAHFAGALALLWSLAPNASPDNLYQALALTARDLGAPGKDDLYGYGMIDVFAAAKMLAPEAFVDSGSGGPSTGRRFLKRSH